MTTIDSKGVDTLIKWADQFLKNNEILLKMIAEEEEEEEEELEDIINDMCPMCGCSNEICKCEEETTKKKK